MADGSYKEIQLIEPGDIVYSYDLEKGTLVKDKVKDLVIHPDYPGGYLVINDQLKVTGNHDLWVVNKSSWERADSLAVGDVLLESSKNETVIKTIEWIGGKNTVYSLHMEGKNKNYFVEDFLVHNLIPKAP